MNNNFRCGSLCDRQVLPTNLVMGTLFKSDLNHSSAVQVTLTPWLRDDWNTVILCKIYGNMTLKLGIPKNLDENVKLLSKVWLLIFN
jgi:hypothetical protein